MSPDNDPSFNKTQATYKPNSKKEGKVESGINQVAQTGLLASFEGTVGKNLRIKNPPPKEAYLNSTPRG